MSLMTVLTPETMTESVLYSTVRLEIEYDDEERGTATGFFFRLTTEQGPGLYLVTSRHAIFGDDNDPACASAITFRLHEAESPENVRPSGRHFDWTLNRPPGPFAYRLATDAAGNTHIVRSIGRISNLGMFFCHVEPTVDLCACAVEPVLEQIFRDTGKVPYCRSLSEQVILEPERLRDLSAVEDVLMVGYPTGIWDAANNLPIFRRGITATHPGIPFEDRPVGLVDVACFRGSSGSPVLICSEGDYFSKTQKGTIPGSRIVLLGVLSGGYVDREGVGVRGPIPTGRKSRRAPDQSTDDNEGEVAERKMRRPRQTSRETEPGSSAVDASKEVHQSIHLGIYEQATKVLEVARQVQRLFDRDVVIRDILSGAAEFQAKHQRAPSIEFSERHGRIVFT